MYIVSVKGGECQGCDRCETICPHAVFEMGADGKSYPSNLSGCVFCESCLSACPAGAITIAEV